MLDSTLGREEISKWSWERAGRGVFLCVIHGVLESKSNTVDLPMEFLSFKRRECGA